MKLLKIYLIAFANDSYKSVLSTQSRVIKADILQTQT